MSRSSIPSEPLLNDNEEENRYPAWLQNLQENSWELELLISGGAVFSLIQLPDYLWGWLSTIKIQTSLPGFAVFLICGILGIKILTNGFVLHLVLRAYWLAIVCLNFVFPAGINSKAGLPRYPFRKSHTHGDLKDLIMRVDKICGLVIFSSISSAIILTALLLAIGFLILLIDQAEFNTTGPAAEAFGIFTNVMLWSGLLYVLDLICLGIFRKLRIVSYLVYPFFSFFDILTFRRLYARPLVFFASNVRKSSFYIGAGIFTMVTLMMVYTSVFRKMGWLNPLDFRKYKFAMSREGLYLGYRLYADESEWQDRQIVYIPSKIIRDNYLTVNVTYINGMDQLVDASQPIDSLRFVDNIVAVSIDDSLYRDVKWFARWEKELSHVGLMAMLPIEGLKNGPHILRVFSPDIPNENYRRIIKEEGREFNIPFWKDVH